jgi:succinyl-CoA:acetate CoA-transferase
MQMETRIQQASLASKIMPAAAAARLIQPGMTVGMSGFTGSGYPKAVPLELARLIEDAHSGFVAITMKGRVKTICEVLLML